MHETLFQPLTMGAIEAKNRVLMAPAHARPRDAAGLGPQCDDGNLLPPARGRGADHH